MYPSARLLPSLGRGIGHAILSPMWPGNRWTREYRQEGAAIGERTAEWLSGSCLLLRRAAFEGVDGFDPRYFMYAEDVDLGDRLGRAGWLNVYVPTAEVTHLGGTRRARCPNACSPSTTAAPTATSPTAIPGRSGRRCGWRCRPALPPAPGCCAAAGSGGSDGSQRHRGEARTHRRSRGNRTR